MHRLDRRLRARRVVVRHETCNNAGKFVTHTHTRTYVNAPSWIDSETTSGTTSDNDRDEISRLGRVLTGRAITNATQATRTLEHGAPRPRLYARSTQLTEAFAHVRMLIYKNFGGYDVAERQEGGDEVRVAEFLRQVVDEEVAALRALDLLVRVGELCLLRRRRRSGRSRRERREP